MKFAMRGATEKYPRIPSGWRVEIHHLQRSTRNSPLSSINAKD
nr:hypothetical protein [Rhodoferax sp.]